MVDVIQDELADAQHGMLQKSLYVVWMHLDAEMAELMPHLEAHHEFVRSLEADGRLFASGPVLDNNGQPIGTSIMILRGDDTEEVAAIAAADPLCKAGLRRPEVTRWRLNMGSFGLALKFSNGSYEVA